MRPTASRLFKAFAPVYNATAASSSSTTSATCASTSKTSSIAASLPPIRYHTFRNPLPYPIGLRVQNELIEYRLDRKSKGAGKTDIILFLEHTPTYTTGRRDNSPNPDTLHPEEKKVQNVGAGFYITKRGGQVTYHGPGQLVGYPILDLNNMETPTKCYVDWLQSVLADYVRDQGCEGVLAPHPEGHVGVFASPTEKIASIGIHLRHRITSHGFAINVTKEPLRWFDLVLACGLADVRATSLHDLITRGATNNGLMPLSKLPSVRDVAGGLVPRLGGILGREMVPLGRDAGAREAMEGESGDGVLEEVEFMREIVERAEEDARRENERVGGWASEPDLSKQIQTEGE